MLKGIAHLMVLQLVQKHIYSFNRICHFEAITSRDTNAEEARLDAALQASQDELSVIR